MNFFLISGLATVKVGVPYLGLKDVQEIQEKIVPFEVVVWEDKPDLYPPRGTIAGIIRNHFGTSKELIDFSVLGFTKMTKDQHYYYVHG